MSLARILACGRTRVGRQLATGFAGALLFGTSLVGLGAPASAAPTTVQPATSRPADGVSVARTTLVVQCAGAPLALPATWYLPSGTPRGFVWLQHGFARTAANLDAQARSYAEHSLVVMAPTISSFSASGCAIASNIASNSTFTEEMASVFAAGTDPTGALGISLHRAEAMAHRSEEPMPTTMIFSGHSAGGEFVLTTADKLRIDHPQQFSRLRGLVLFDPVASFVGDGFATAATDLANANGKGGGPTIRVIASPPSPSNADGRGVLILSTSTHQAFLGTRLTTGIHIDVEGESTDILGIASELAVPDPRNVAVLRTLSNAWATDIFDGGFQSEYYPGGTYYDALISTHRATTLSVGAAR
ncbi:alpha/beta hydrolase [Gordonia jinhuaensis]|nr:alpha/beta hydrolase [Gordonia jinhuaensis]